MTWIKLTCLENAGARIRQLRQERAKPPRPGPLLFTGAAAPSDEARAASDAAGADVVSTAGLDEIVEYRPRDLTITVGAGMRIGRLLESLREEGQWLPVAGPAAGRSVGGWIAGAPPGPLDAAFGPVRRQLLACHAETESGTSLRWGRAVMKNVAGYDMPRLLCGSFGRLGLVTRATFRLWPLPPHARALELRSEGRETPELAADLARIPAGEDFHPDAAVWRAEAPGDGGEGRGRAAAEGSGRTAGGGRRRAAADPEEGRAGDDGRLLLWLLGSRESVEAREDLARRWAARRGAALSPAPPSLDSFGRGDVHDGMPGPGRGPKADRPRPGAPSGRPLDIGVAGISFPRARFRAAVRRARTAAAGRLVSLEGYPLLGFLRCAWRRPGGPAPAPGGDPGEAEATEPLRRLMEALPDAAVRVERGSAADLEAAERRRPAAVRRAEGEVIRALEGRPRHWLSSYV